MSRPSRTVLTSGLVGYSPTAMMSARLAGALATIVWVAAAAAFGLGLGSTFLRPRSEDSIAPLRRRQNFTLDVHGRANYAGGTPWCVSGSQ